MNWLKSNWKILAIVGVIGIAALGGIMWYLMSGNNKSTFKGVDKKEGNIEDISGEFVTSGNSKYQEILFTADGPKQAIGKFNKFDVKLSMDGSLESMQIDVSIDAASLDTKNGTRDGHLRDKKEFFNVSAHPKITFTSSEIIEKGGKFLAKGTLNFLGKDHDYEFPFKFEGFGELDGKEVVGFSGDFGFPQFKYGMTKDESIEPTTKISFKVDLFREGEAPVAADDEEEDDFDDDWDDEEDSSSEPISPYDELLDKVEEEAGL
jgi:polyisoprenoid-binding protein YceI